MSRLDKYRKNVFVKAVVIPLIITFTTIIILLFALPKIQACLPNAQKYSQQMQTEEVQKNE
ncbi:MAG: hypothetical protein NC213_05685 [Acetobacter sp.]|nr:hypothetical protein [Bacteroides sp.]MCM1341219.1 hypothetical protein [Acetobacter sp.]MCM1433862.1 hypothetical protein [Clostridiales bacterium]